MGESNNPNKSETEQQKVKKPTYKDAYHELKVAHSRLEEKCNNALSLAREYKADMERMKERAKNIEQEKTKQVAEKSVLAFLPVLDNLEIALNGCRDPQVAKGFSLIKQQFEDVIAQMGATRVDTAGEFDPSFHECISTIPAPSEKEKNKIAHVLKAGYVQFEKVIRPAQVVVYQ